MRVARLVRRTGLAVALAGGVALAGVAAPAFAVPGNNGTIKIDNVEFDDDPNNEPHVDCEFQVDFYGYDKGDLDALVTFRVWPPTGDKETLVTDTVFIGEDDNSGGGSQAGLDASKTYKLDLSDYDPEPNQGFHIKLTINADGSQGADVKHKVFWVQECDEPTPTPTPTETKKPDDEETEKPDDEESEEPEAVPTAVPAGTDSSGGGSAAGLLGVALTAGGAVAGTAVLVRRRRFLHDS